MVVRRGGSKLGCLFSVLLFSALIYFGFNVGEHVWNYFEFRDAIQSEVRFAASRSDAEIRARLQRRVEELGLPSAARNVIIRRIGRNISISSDYYIYVEFPGYVREIHFAPRAQGIF